MFVPDDPDLQQRSGAGFKHSSCVRSGIGAADMELNTGTTYESAVNEAVHAILSLTPAGIGGSASRATR
jgi:hypothetical protein